VTLPGFTSSAMDEIRKDGTYDRLYKKYFGEKI
jgi:ABC-type amino acid transport substrate-binding protein